MDQRRREEYLVSERQRKQLGRRIAKFLAQTREVCALQAQDGFQVKQGTEEHYRWSDYSVEPAIIRLTFKDERWKVSAAPWHLNHGTGIYPLLRKRLSPAANKPTELQEMLAAQKERVRYRRVTRLLAEAKRLEPWLRLHAKANLKEPLVKLALQAEAGVGAVQALAHQQAIREAAAVVKKGNGKLDYTERITQLFLLRGMRADEARVAASVAQDKHSKRCAARCRNEPLQKIAYVTWSKRQTLSHWRLLRAAKLPLSLRDHAERIRLDNKNGPQAENIKAAFRRCRGSLRGYRAYYAMPSMFPGARLDGSRKGHLNIEIGSFEIKSPDGRIHVVVFDQIATITRDGETWKMQWIDEGEQDQKIDLAWRQGHWHRIYRRDRKAGKAGKAKKARKARKGGAR